MIDKRMLAEYAAALGLPLGEAERERFDRYAELLVEWNERMNLTAITEPGEIVVKHFVDSLTLLRRSHPPWGRPWSTWGRCGLSVGAGEDRAARPAGHAA